MNKITAETVVTIWVCPSCSKKNFTTLTPENTTIHERNVFTPSMHYALSTKCHCRKCKLVTELTLMSLN